MPITEYEYFMDNYSFHHLDLLLKQFYEDQQEETELMELAVMYGYASARSKNGKLIKIFEKPKEVAELSPAQIEEIKQNREDLKLTFSNTLEG